VYTLPPSYRVYPPSLISCIPSLPHIVYTLPPSYRVYPPSLISCIPSLPPYLISCIPSLPHIQTIIINYPSFAIVLCRVAGFRRHLNKVFALSRCYTALVGMLLRTFRDGQSVQTPISSSAASLLKMESICFPETSVTISQRCVTSRKNRSA